MGAAAAFVGVSTLAIGGSATAADYYVDDSDLTAIETTFYPEGWFQGTVAPGGSFVSTVSGLDVNGQIQILNGTPAATDLLTVGAGITLASGVASFQIPVFTDGSGGGFTTLYADTAGIAADLWYTSTAFGTFAANDSATLAEFVAQMDPGYEILAFGFHVIAGDSAEVVSLTWAGNTHWFLPVPTATITPASLTVEQMGKTGVSGVFTGFVPGEAVTAGISSGRSGDSLPGSYTADATGSVTVAHSDAPLAPGTYHLSTFAAGSGAYASGSFAVVANPAVIVADPTVVVADPAVLAATGAEVTPFVIAGSLLLLTGAGLGAVAIRRRATAASS